MKALGEYTASVREQTGLDVVVAPYFEKHVAFLVDPKAADDVTTMIMQSEVILDDRDSGCDEDFITQELSGGIGNTPETAVANAYHAWNARLTLQQGPAEHLALEDEPWKQQAA